MARLPWIPNTCVWPKYLFGDMDSPGKMKGNKQKVTGYSFNTPLGVCAGKMRPCIPKVRMPGSSPQVMPAHSPAPPPNAPEPLTPSSNPHPTRRKEMRRMTSFQRLWLYWPIQSHNRPRKGHPNKLISHKSRSFPLRWYIYMQDSAQTIQKSAHRNKQNTLCPNSEKHMSHDEILAQSPPESVKNSMGVRGRDGRGLRAVPFLDTKEGLSMMEKIGH